MLKEKYGLWSQISVTNDFLLEFSNTQGVVTWPQNCCRVLHSLVLDLRVTGAALKQHFPCDLKSVTAFLQHRRRKKGKGVTN